MADLVGLKFPFQINKKGGVSLVKQSKESTDLLDGKLEQLLGTSKGDRVMECEVFSELDTFIFEPTDASTKTLLEYQIKEAILKHMPEISIVSINIYSLNRAIIADIVYKDVAYGTTNLGRVKVGDMG